MDDRYEIRSKIGEGGVGAVYRAFDKHLNREVAIKRVIAGGAGEDREDATGSMLKEAASLSSLQHPHIVTIYDSGTDQDGPYVVMELLSGRTIDEMVERGILTYEDFREVALQSQEALIAAQDLDLVHRDIKPSNLMITWLPSGRFHTKLVDFGLAKFQPMPSHQTVDHGDSVFGSIRFMAPEQFERTPLDKRTDMYSLGCVYYYCLTGKFPFDGETAPQVMTSHLQGKVIPLHELRPDLPQWLCDWVMWHMARNMDERPVDARNSLTQFLMGENKAKEDTSSIPNIPNTIGQQPPTVVPNSGSSGPANTTAPQPIQPPEGHSPSIHTAAQTVQPQTAPQPRLVIPSQTPAPNPNTAPVPSPVTAPVPAQTAPQPVPGNTTGVQVTPAPQVTVPLAGTTPPAAKPVFVTGGAATQAPAPVAPAPQPALGPTSPIQSQASGVGIGSLPSSAKKGISTPVKVMIAATLVAAIIVFAVIYSGKSAQNDKIERLNEITANFKDPDNLPTEIPLTGEDVDLLLNEMVSVTSRESNERIGYLKALQIAKATDGSDVSLKIATFAKDVKMESSLREKLFMVVERRGDASALPPLIAFASGTDDTNSGAAALRAASKMATASNFQDLLAIITNSTNGSIKSEAVKVLGPVIAKAEDPGSYATPIIKSYNLVADDISRASLLRLMGSAGGDEVADLVAESLESDNETMKIAGVLALADWPDDSQFETLLEYTKNEDTDRLRKEAFEALVDFLKKCPGIEEEDKSLYWNDVAVIATGTKEQINVIDQMPEQGAAWADDILDYFIENADNDTVGARAETAKDRLDEKIRRAKRSGGGKDDDSDE